MPSLIKNLALAQIAFVFSLPLVLAGSGAHAQASRLLQTGVPAPDAELAAKLRPYLEARTGGVIGWTPKGDGIVISTRFGNTAQLHLVANPMGMRKQITFAQEPVTAAEINQNPRLPRAIFAADVGGNEQFQLYAYDFASQGTTSLTNDTKKQYEGPIFSVDGSAYAVASADSAGVHRIEMGDLGKPGALKVVWDKAGSWAPIAFAPDGKSLLVLRYTSVLQSALYELTLSTGKLQNVSKEKDAAAGTGLYTPDGKSVYFAGDQGAQFRGVYRFDRKSKTVSAVLSDQYADVEALALNHAGNKLAVNLNDRGTSRVLLIDLLDAKAKRDELTAPPSVISKIAFHPTEDRLLLAMNGPQVPGDAFVYALKTQSLTRWTEHELGGLRASDFAEPQVFQTVGGVGEKAYNLPAWVYFPNATGPRPVVVLIHGGPESQARGGFDPWAQFLVRELNVAVIAPNVRGSSGYGREYLGMDDGMLRMDAVTDIGAILEWIKSNKQLDASRVAVMGGSYGGFMTLASLQAYPEAFKAGIDIVGVSDFNSFLKNTAPYRQDLRRVEYGDERIPKMRQFFDDISPLKNARKIQAPLFVIQGANDPRVPLSEAEQIASAVKAGGHAVWTMTATNEGHGFKKKENVDQMRLAIAQFLQEFLLK
jgi:dipeptidyl aminopeptidase/acylaminoacyl peptidase